MIAESIRQEDRRILRYLYTHVNFRTQIFTLSKPQAVAVVLAST